MMTRKGLTWLARDSYDRRHRKTSVRRVLTAVLIVAGCRSAAPPPTGILVEVGTRVPVDCVEVEASNATTGGLARAEVDLSRPPFDSQDWMHPLDSSGAPRGLTARILVTPGNTLG